MTSKLYYESIEFWKRQGVELEDNLIALALNDVGVSIPYYSKIYNNLLPVLSSVVDMNVERPLAKFGI